MVSKVNGSLARRARAYGPRAENAGPILLSGTSNKDREIMRDIINAGRRDKSSRRELSIDSIACPPGKCPVAVLQSDAPLPADWTERYCPHHEVIQPWQKNLSSNRGRIGLCPWRLAISLKKPCWSAPKNLKWRDKVDA
jgi:hypothetical protein